MHYSLISKKELHQFIYSQFGINPNQTVRLNNTGAYVAQILINEKLQAHTCSIKLYIQNRFQSQVKINMINKTGNENRTQS